QDCESYLWWSIVWWGCQGEDNSSILGGRTEDCEESFEDPESKGKAGLKELENGKIKANPFSTVERGIEKFWCGYDQ
ncbi:hypothetical protein CISIN_1g040105mg, partial [Citrus sinensis]